MLSAENVVLLLEEEVFLFPNREPIIPFVHM